MGRVGLLGTVTAGVVLALGVLLVLQAGVAAEVTAPAPVVRYVLAEGGTDSSDCSNSQAPCDTVQYAVAQARTKDIIQVADRTVPGVYLGTVVLTKSITLQGGWHVTVGPKGVLWSRHGCEPARTVLDGGGAGRVISITGAIKPVIDCFTITGGSAEGLGGDPGDPPGSGSPDAGGGIYSRDAAPIIINNVITANFGCSPCGSDYGRGGGLYMLNAPATALISGNLLARNVADDGTWGQGGGLMLRDSDAQVRFNTFHHNRAGLGAGDGGGLAIVGGQPTVADNTFAWNVCINGGVVGLGGGMYVWSSAPVTIERNLFDHNRAVGGSTVGDLASAGGGLYVAGRPSVAAVIRDNVLLENVATFGSGHGLGGGMALHDLASPSLVSGNRLEGNVGGFAGSGKGGGLYILTSTLTLSENTIVDNAATWSGEEGRGGGAYLQGGAVLMASNVISGNHGAVFVGAPTFPRGYGGGVAVDDSAATLRGNLIVGNVGTNDTMGGGGGVWGSGDQLRIEGNTIEGNVASAGFSSDGGGLYLVKTLDAVVVDNVVRGNSSGRDGGGLYLETCPDAVVEHNLIEDNGSGLRGGGLCAHNGGGSVLARNVVRYNRAPDAGGLQLDSDEPPDQRLTLLNNIVVENDATAAAFAGTPGIVIQSLSADLRHLTVARNLSGNGWGILVDDAMATVANTILVSQTVGVQVTASGAVALTTTLLGAGGWANGSDWGGAGIVVTSDNRWGLPAFVDPDAGDYHILASSPAVDACGDRGVTTDVDGDPRPVGVAPDIGADEVARRVLLPLVMRE
jgi:hypothetical protein